MPEIRLIIGMCYYNLGVDYWGIAYQYLKDNKLVDESIYIKLYVYSEKF